ncbi:MAG TPA: AsmA family protein [Longimicrobiales bacterium]|nr:AsmA family protein [Longimicrobiales bacterium]
MRPRRVRIAQGHLDPLVESTRRPSRPAARAKRRPSTLRYALIAAGLGGVGLLALAVTNLYLTLDSDEVAEWVTPRASAVLNRPVAFGAAGLSLWPRPSVRVTDVEVGNLADFDGPALARIDAARLDVSWLPLVVGRVHVQRLVLEGVQLHLAIDEHGKSNFGDLVPSSAAPARALPEAVALRIRAISLSDGSLTFFDAEAGRSLGVSGIDAEAVLAPGEEGGWRSTLAARSDSLLVRFSGVGEQVVRGGGPTAVVVAHGGGEPGNVTIDEGHLAFADDTLAVYGALSLGSPEPSFDLLFTGEDFSPRFLTSFFEPDARSELLPHVEGSMRVMVQLQGGADAPPRIRGSVRMRDVGLRLRGEPLVDRLRGIVALTPDTIVFDSLSGRFAGGPFELSGTLARSAGVAAFVARGRPRLEALDRLGLLPEGMALSGDADLYLSVVGSSTSLDSVEVVGAAGLSGLQMVHPRLNVPLYVPSGEISLVGREARWSEVAMLVGHDQVMTSGSVLEPLAFLYRSERRPRVELTLAAARLDLSRALPARDTASEVSYAQLALAHLGGQEVGGQAASAVAAARGMARPARLPVVGTIGLSVDTLLLRRQTLERVTAHVEIEDSALHMPELSFEAWEGRATASLFLGVGPDPAEPFALALSVQEARAEDFLAAMSPLGDAVSGTLDLSLDAQGATDAALLPHGKNLVGVVAATIQDGAVGGTAVNMALADFLGDEAWTNVGFSDWDLDIRIADRMLHIREATLAGETGEVVISGPLGLDGSADLAVGLSIPPDHLHDLSLRRTGIAQSVLERLRAAGGSLDLGLRLSGWLQAPTLEPDASQSVAQAR